MIALFQKIRDRIAVVKAAPEEISRSSAALIEAKLKRDATTKRGNVPSFGKMGDVPIVATPSTDAITVSGPDWVVNKAADKGQIDGWVDIVHGECSRVLAQGKL